MRHGFFGAFAALLLMVPSAQAADLPADGQATKTLSAFPRDENGKPASSFSHQGKPISAFHKNGKPLSAFPRDENGKPVSSFHPPIRREEKSSATANGVVMVKEPSITKSVFCARYPNASSCASAAGGKETITGSGVAYAPPPEVESSDKH